MKCFMPHGSPTGLILNPGYDWKCQNWVAALDMGTEGRERGGPSDKYTLGTVLPASGQCHLLQRGWFLSWSLRCPVYRARGGVV